MAYSGVNIYRIRERTGWDSTVISDSGIEYAIADAVQYINDFTGESITSGSPGKLIGPLTDMACYYASLRVIGKATSDIGAYKIGRLSVTKTIRGLQEVADLYFKAAERGLVKYLNEVKFELVSGTVEAEGAESAYDETEDIFVSPGYTI